MKILKEISQKLFIIAILSLFILKGVFLSLLIPLFQNPDEQIHYGTIQHWAEPREKTWEVLRYNPGEHTTNNPNDVRTYRLSQEVSETAAMMGFDEIKFQGQNTQNFDDTATENIIHENSWHRYVETTPSAVSGTWSWYYLIGAKIEHWFSGEDIFARMIALRFFSVLLGIGVIAFSYLAIKKIGFSDLESLLIVGLIAFQPMFSASAAQINIDIALIFSFALFIYAGIGLLQSDKKKTLEILGWIALLIIASSLGILAKGPGIVLAAMIFPLFIYTGVDIFRQRFSGKTAILRMSGCMLWFSFCLIILIFGGCIATIVPTSYWTSITHASATSKFDSPLESLSDYLGKTISSRAFHRSAVSYWGNFGWLDTQISGDVFEYIWFVEIVGLFGVLLSLLSGTWYGTRWLAQRQNSFLRHISEYFSHKRDFLPKRALILSLIILSLALQFAIRFYDWRVFDATGKILIGTPGRYFLPMITAHIILLVTGLGFFCRSRIQFQWLLKSLLVCMILLSTYSFFDIILLRYYL